jgi:hypothetical protein
MHQATECKARDVLFNSTTVSNIEKKYLNVRIAVTDVTTLDIFPCYRGLAQEKNGDSFESQVHRSS